MLRLTLRNLLARKVRLLMSALSIVIGVGFLAGVLTFNHGLQSTFDGIIKGSTPEAMVRPAGLDSFSEQGPPSTISLPPAKVRELEALPEVERADGNVDGTGMFLLDEDKKLVGGQGAPTIAFNFSQTPNLLGEPTLLLEEGAWPSGPGQVALDTGAAERAGYEVGDRVSFIAPRGKPLRTAELVGLANFNGGGTAGAILVIFETRAAQEIFLEGRNAFTSVSLTAAAGVSQKELAAAARPVLPPEFTAVTGDKVVSESQASINQFLGVITQFLLVFALIAIVVGAFIIANTFSILVAQRVRELALLRALGAGRKQVVRSVLVEAFVMALLASTIGIAVGWSLARGLAALFRAVGLDIAGEALSLTTATVLTSYAVGIVVTVASAYLPARRASKVAPVAAMRDDVAEVETSLRRRTFIAAVVAVLATGAALWGLAGAPGNDTVWIGAAGVVWILVLAAVSPVVGRPLLRLCRNVFGRLFGTAGQLAGENALRNPRRTGATSSALMIGLALVSTIGVLAASLNGSVDKMVDDQFTADFLVQGPTFAPFPTAIGDRIEEIPGVQTMSRQQFSAAKVEKETEYLSGLSAEFADIYELTMVEGSPALGRRNLLLSEDKARDLDAKVGGTVKLDFPGGHSQELPVTGIFEGTPVTSGMVVPLAVLERAGVDRVDSDLSILAAPGVDKSELKTAIDKSMEPFPIVSAQDKREFAESIRSQVNQLLYMIYGLLALAIIIAVIGIVNTLGLSVIERTREIGLLRAIGLSRRRLRRMVTLESVVIALLGAVLGMALGLVLGIALRQSLAADIEVLALPISQLVLFLGLAVVVGVLAALLPAARASRLKVLDAIAHE